jgi:cytosine/adenosine deaminase-related metal-dependent hydrolase
LFRAAANLSKKTAVPLAVHVAESAAEVELLGAHTGPFVDFLTGLSVWDSDGLVPSAEHLLTLLAELPNAVFVHGNYLDGALLAGGVAGTSSSVVYCPRTHAAFGHDPHPFRDFLRRGVRVALGTDSLASNPDLDVLAEARWLHAHHPDVDPQVIVRMATLAGAEALGWGRETGSLTPGKSADLVIVPITDRTPEPCQAVLESRLPVQAVYCKGRPAYPG